MKNLNAPPQPPATDWAFVRELALPEIRRCHWRRREAVPGEADLSGGIRLVPEAADPKGRLDSVYDDLKRLAATCGLPENGRYPVATALDGRLESGGDAFQITVGLDGARIAAGCLEGIRRGVYHFEDMLLGADGPSLPPEEINRKPWAKSRISRCFFGPIKRPPLNRDELLDETDYYPDEYLNRLAREGVNGLWLTISFKDLCRTAITPEHGRDAVRRLNKLARTVEKCLRYGIRIYIFCIEPVALHRGDPVLQRHPELGGAKFGEFHYFCPFSDTARQYLFEAVNGIFTAVPELGGMINISHGERATSCLSATAANEDRRIECPRCGTKQPGEILRATLQPMEQGMHAAAPQAELISWLYMPQPTELGNWVFTLPPHIPEKVVLQFNFESGGVKEQLGKPRIGGDYWLSFTGPADSFRRIAESAARNGVPLSAKIQAGCSHEVATAPFVPVPPLLYRKYREMKQAGVSRVMQCWYFGNYPGVMNKAAGKLAYEEFSRSEDDFLEQLARPDWGAHAPEVIRAWNCFAEGYSCYPMSNMFQYYGPMHDGVVWPLYLTPSLKPLAPTWKLEYGTSGDAIGECLENHTLPEAVRLCGNMAENWRRGVDILSALRDDFRDDPERLKDIGVAEALGLQFESGHAILRFYELRKELNFQADRSILDEMELLVRAEIQRSKRLAELCREDSRLGFHSEAEGYKYFPEKLEWRITLLESLLAEDFPAVRQRLADGQPAFDAPETPYRYLCGSGRMEECGTFRWQARQEDQMLRIDVECRGIGRFGDHVLLAVSWSDTEFPLLVLPTASGKCHYAPPRVLIKITRGADDWQAEVRIPLPENAPEQVRFRISRHAELDGRPQYHHWGAGADTMERLRLNLDVYLPGDGGLLILEPGQSE
jgi:hypothetical protein